jgi:hypothetical protein
MPIDYDDDGDINAELLVHLFIVAFVVVVFVL